MVRTKYCINLVWEELIFLEFESKLRKSTVTVTKLTLEYTLPGDLPQGSYALRAGRGEDAVYIPCFDVTGTNDSHTTKTVASSITTPSKSSEAPKSEASSHHLKAIDHTHANCTFKTELYKSNSNNHTRNMYSQYAK
ncbi:hypothetical protein K7432_003363 [Basidiobolus ranarum]|uniref:Uncharacterized protein n=1 Tax=Basidiobolus ranarum TaxID=34480 RepID=A0ABR2X083_9FUNG